MKNTQNESIRKLSRKLFGQAIFIGWIGGILWSACFAVAYYFNFTEIAPKTYFLKPWFHKEWTDQFSGHLISILIAGILSLIPAIFYFVTLKRIHSVWVGVGFGIVLWAIVFFLLQPMLTYTKPMYELRHETWVTSICIFILYGVFVGYSIAYNYHETVIRMLKRKTET